MKRCLNCNRLKDATQNRCAACGTSMTMIDGFEAFAPEYAHGGGGFKPHYFETLFNLEETNFWFRARNRLIIWALKKYLSNVHSFLEIGCGNGYVLSGLSKAFPKTTLQGAEIFTEGLGFAAKRLPLANFMQMDARNIPYYYEFEAIGAFDVIEHIEEDEVVLKQIHTALKSEGIVLISVPQHEWLWSHFDEHACHVRRYTQEDLENKIEAAGFEILRSTSFVTTLLPAMMVSRTLQKKPSAKFDATAELKLPKIINTLFYCIMLFDICLIKIGINLPVGGSRLVVARKIGTKK